MKALEYVLGVASVVLNDNSNVDDNQNAGFLPSYTEEESSSSNDYSYYMFRMQVPGSYCQTSYCDSSLEEKLMPNGFKIHGLWPSNPNSEGPAYCRNDNFNENDIDSQVLEKMNTYWPSDRGSNTSFWTHEWEKHGVCAHDVPDYGSGYLSENTFFTLVTNLFQEYNPTEVLSNNDITASNYNSYDLEDIKSAFSNAYSGVTPVTTCQTSGDKTYLMSISLCLDLNLSPKSCPYATSNCSGGDVYIGAL